MPSPFDELRLHVDALAGLAEGDAFFKPVAHYLATLRRIVSGSASDIDLAEVKSLVAHIDAYLGQYRASGDGLYIPPTSARDAELPFQQIRHALTEIDGLSAVGMLAMIATGESTKMKDPRAIQNSKAKSRHVFIGHGANKLWARLQIHLADDLKLTAVAYESESHVGESIVPVLEGFLDQCGFAILILTAEDETANGTVRARQNVVHEAGLFQGRLGFKKAVLLLQDGLEGFSNIAGLQYIPFSGDKVEQTFYELGRVLAREGVITS